MDQVAAHRAGFGDLTVREFINELASAEPTPGGGSASAIAASLAAGLVVMVASLSLGRPRYAAYAPTHVRVEDAGRRLAEELLTLADADAAAYSVFAAALKQPRATAEEDSSRRSAVRSAARAASEIPLDLLDRCVEVLSLAVALAGRSNRNASSDLLVAVGFGLAAAEGAAENVRVNLPAVADESYSDATLRHVERSLAAARERAGEVRAVVADGGPRPPEAESVSASQTGAAR